MAKITKNNNKLAPLAHHIQQYVTNLPKPKPTASKVLWVNAARHQAVAVVSQSTPILNKMTHDFLKQQQLPEQQQAMGQALTHINSLLQDQAPAPVMQPKVDQLNADSLNPLTPAPPLSDFINDKEALKNGDSCLEIYIKNKMILELQQQQLNDALSLNNPRLQPVIDPSITYGLSSNSVDIEEISEVELQGENSLLRREELVQAFENTLHNLEEKAIDQHHQDEMELESELQQTQTPEPSPQAKPAYSHHHQKEHRIEKKIEERVIHKMEKLGKECIEKLLKKTIGLSPDLESAMKAPRPNMNKTSG